MTSTLYIVQYANGRKTHAMPLRLAKRRLNYGCSLIPVTKDELRAEQAIRTAANAAAEADRGARVARGETACRLTGEWHQGRCEKCKVYDAAVANKIAFEDKCIQWACGNGY